MAAGTGPIPGGDLKALGSSARSQQQLANTLYITSGVCGLAAGVEALFTDWRGDRSLPFAPLPLAGGGGLAVAGRF